MLTDDFFSRRDVMRLSALLTAAGNSFGARWFDLDWRPEFRSPEWRQTLDFYVELMQDAAPPGAAFRGYADIEINNAFPMMLRQFDRAMDQVIRTRLRETAIGMLPQADEFRKRLAARRPDLPALSSSASGALAEAGGCGA